MGGPYFSSIVWVNAQNNDYLVGRLLVIFGSSLRPATPFSGACLPTALDCQSIDPLFLLSISFFCSGGESVG
jgi:hypothetical protein